VTGEGRDPALPNVPNLSESGLPVRIRTNSSAWSGRPTCRLR
jgi:hypothetical protein